MGFCTETESPARCRCYVWHRHPAGVALLPSPQGSGTLRLLGVLWRREIDKIKKEKSNQSGISVVE